MEKFTIYGKIEIVMEPFKSNNIAELCRRYGGAVSNFYKWRDKFIESGRSGNNEYENERLVDDQHWLPMN